MSNKIIVFTLDGCHHCATLKEELNRLSIPFTEIEVNHNPTIWDQVVKQTNNEYLPTVFIQKDNTNVGPVYVPDKDFETQDELIEIIKTHLEGE
jgi:glutaredoxin